MLKQIVSLWGEWCPKQIILDVLPTKQVIPGEGVQDARGSDEVTHGSREGGGVNTNYDEGVPDVDVPQETVIPLKQDAVWTTSKTQIEHKATVLR